MAIACAANFHPGRDFPELRAERRVVLLEFAERGHRRAAVHDLHAGSLPFENVSTYIIVETPKILRGGENFMWE